MEGHAVRELICSGVKALSRPNAVPSINTAGRPILFPMPIGGGRQWGKRASGGRIIMIGSAVGERVAAPGLVPYAATKGAVKMFNQALAREIGSRGITVN